MQWTTRCLFCSLFYFSRGGVVDQDALINALKNKQIKAAGIDVMYPEPLPQNHELVKLPNIGKKWYK